MRWPAEDGADWALMFTGPRDNGGELLMENRGQGKNPVRLVDHKLLSSWHCLPLTWSTLNRDSRTILE